MATYSTPNVQSTTEIKTYTVDFTNDLPTGGSLTGGTVTHIPPSGSAGTPTVTVTSPYLYITFGPVTTLGQHYLDVSGTISDGDIPSVRVPISIVYPTATARIGMLDIIEEVRGMTEAGAGDYISAGIPYWSDGQLQNILDLHRVDLTFSPLQSFPVQVQGGSLQYFEFRSSYNFFEATTGATAIFYLQDSTGATAGTGLWTADYRRGVITFASDVKGTAYYLTGRSYDLNAAAADVWRKKAAHYAPTAFNFSTDNHRIDREQVYTHCLDQARFFESLSGDAVQTVQMYRSDAC